MYGFGKIFAALDFTQNYVECEIWIFEKMSHCLWRLVHCEMPDKVKTEPRRFWLELRSVSAAISYHHPHYHHAILAQFPQLLRSVATQQQQLSLTDISLTIARLQSGSPIKLSFHPFSSTDYFHKFHPSLDIGWPALWACNLKQIGCLVGWICCNNMQINMKCYDDYAMLTSGLSYHLKASACHINNISDTSHYSTSIWPCN